MNRGLNLYDGSRNVRLMMVAAAAVRTMIMMVMMMPVVVRMNVAMAAVGVGKRWNGAAISRTCAPSSRSSSAMPLSRRIGSTRR